MCDSYAPLFANPVNSSAGFRRFDRFSAGVSVSDNVLVDFVWFSSNISGLWVNDSAISVKAASFIASAGGNISLPRGNVVCWMFFANDSAGSLGNSAVFCFGVANTPPVFNQSPGVYFNASAGGSFDVDVNCSDRDSDSIAYSVNDSLLAVNSVTGVISDSLSEQLT